MRSIYIAGPMTGKPDYNFPEFARLAKKWEARGWAVHNPATSFNGSTRLPYKAYMHAAVQLLLQSDAIALMGGWEESAGAKMESLIAQRLQLPFYNAETFSRMRLSCLTVAPPTVIASGEKGEAPNAELIRRLAPVALKLARDYDEKGITVSDIRAEAEELGILDGTEDRSTLSALGRVPEAAGLLSIPGHMRPASVPSAKRRMQRVYYHPPTSVPPASAVELKTF